MLALGSAKHVQGQQRDVSRKHFPSIFCFGVVFFGHRHQQHIAHIDNPLESSVRKGVFIDCVRGTLSALLTPCLVRDASPEPLQMSVRTCSYKDMIQFAPDVTHNYCRNSGRL